MVEQGMDDRDLAIDFWMQCLCGVWLVPVLCTVHCASVRVRVRARAESAAAARPTD